MKTIIIPFFDGIVARNILSTDVRRILVERGIRLVLLPPETKEDLYEQKWADGKNIFVEKTPVWKNSRIDSAIQNLFLQSIPTEFMRIRQVDWYLHNKKYFHYVGVTILRFFGQFKLYRFLIRKLALMVQPIRPEVYKIFEKWKPDAVFLPTMIPAIEVALARLAKERGKVVIGMAKSWDNFSSKAFIRVFPDWIIVHNELQIEEASNLFDYPRDRVVVTGIPQMDHYRDDSFTVPREDFCKKLGLDPNKKIILYAPAGDWMNPNDKETLEMILDWIQDGTLQNCQVLLRLHPGYKSRTEELKGRENLVVERPGKRIGDRLKSVEFDEDDMQHLASSIKHSAVVLHTASTIGMESAFLDRPTIHIGFDGNKELSYWNSVIRYYDREHCIPFVKSECGRLVKSKEELKKSLLDYIENESLDHAGRERLVSMLCYKADGKAGERIGNFIADVTKRKYI